MRVTATMRFWCVWDMCLTVNYLGTAVEEHKTFYGFRIPWSRWEDWATSKAGIIELQETHPGAGQGRYRRDYSVFYWASRNPFA